MSRLKLILSNSNCSSNLLRSFLKFHMLFSTLLQFVFNRKRNRWLKKIILIRTEESSSFESDGAITTKIELIYIYIETIEINCQNTISMQINRYQPIKKADSRIASSITSRKSLLFCHTIRWQ